MVESFIVRSWLDNQQWGDEPPDPDDVWTEGDRVRLKGSTSEGTVQALSSQPFLGGYVPYIQVLWDGKAIPVPVEPDLLVRLSRTLSEQVTWQAAESFSPPVAWVGKTPVPATDWLPSRSASSECKGVLSVPVTQLITQGEIMPETKFVTPSIEHDDIDEASAVSVSVRLSAHAEVRTEEFYLAQTAGIELEELKETEETTAQFKPGDIVYVKRGKKRVKRTVGDCIGTGNKSGKILTLGGRSGKEEYWDFPFNLELCQLNLDLNELLEFLGDSTFVSTVTLARLSKYDEAQILKGLETLLEQGKVNKKLCPDGKTFLWQKVEPALGEASSLEVTGVAVSVTQGSDILTKVYDSLPTGNSALGDWDIVKELGYEFALVEVSKALNQLESEGRAIKLNSNGGMVWQKSPKNLQSTIFVQESDSVIPLQAQSSDNTLNLSDSVKSMTTAETSSNSDIPVFELSETSELEQRLQELEQESCLGHFHVNPSALPENATGQPTSEISSPTSSTSLTASDQTTSLLKTFPESSSAPTSLEEPPADFLNGFSGNFTSGGTMLNGKLSQAPTLALPSLESGLFWLRSPQALSSTSETSRPPGQTKLEIQLKELGLIGNNQVINPEFLAKGLYNLPTNWASLSELRAATEILEISEKLTETALIQESLIQYSTTSPKLSERELPQFPSEQDESSSVSVTQQKDEELLSVSVTQHKDEEPLSVSLTQHKDEEPLSVSLTQQEDEEPLSVSLTQQEDEELLSVSLTQQETIIQNDNSSFEWRGAGNYWIYPESVSMALGTQCRVETDQETVKYYAAQMKDDLWEWEASVIGLLWDGDQLIPYDGHHRLEAAHFAGKMILARIEEGDLHKAIALSCGSNKKPSLRRTREDNQKTIQMLEDLRASNGDEWLLNIINAQLPVDKHFKEVSLRAIETYTGIPFKTISRIRNRVKTNDSEKVARIHFAPTDEEMKLIQSIMDAEGLEKPSEVIHWLLEEYKKS